MPFEQLDRFKVHCKPLLARPNKVHIEADHVAPDAKPKPLGERGDAAIEETIQRLVKARDTGASRMLAFGAHSFKNGLAPVFVKLIEDGWITHLATNGAGIIHDWEFAFQGHSSEDVRANVRRGWHLRDLLKPRSVGAIAGSAMAASAPVGKVYSKPISSPRSPLPAAATRVRPQPRVSFVPHRSRNGCNPPRTVEDSVPPSTMIGHDIIYVIR